MKLKKTLSNTVNRNVDSYSHTEYIYIYILSLNAKIVVKC